MSSVKSGKGSEMAKLSESIEKHGESLLVIAKLAALQQDKDSCHAHMDSICLRIDSLCDAKRNLVIWLALNEVSINMSVANAILHEVAMMEDEIKQNMENLNSIEGTPQKSNLVLTSSN